MLEEGQGIDAAVIALVIASAVLHPLRDLFLKRVGDGFSAYLAVCLVWVGLAAVEAIAAGQALVLPVAAISLALVSAAGLVAYYGGTLLAMRWGELSVAYPIIRSSPVAIVIIGWAFLGASYEALTLVGIGLIVAAGFGLQRHRGRLIGAPAAMAAALVALVGSAVYALADARAMQLVAPAPFLFWVYMGVSAGLAVAGRIAAGHAGARAPGSGLATVIRAVPLRIAAAGAASYLSYRLILAAFQLGGDPAAVTAVRQVSIPVSILLAVYVLGEARGMQKLGYGLVMAAGIALLAR